MSGRASRDKGTRVERELAKKLTEVGVPTRRVVGSGAYGCLDSRLAGDLQIGTYGPEGTEGWLLTGEVKARKGGTGFVQLDKWLGDNDILLLKQNNREPLAYMPWRTLVPLLEAFYRSEVNDGGDHTTGSSNLPSHECDDGRKK